MTEKGRLRELEAALAVFGPRQPTAFQVAAEALPEVMNAELSTCYDLLRGETGIEIDRVEGKGIDTARARQIFNNVIRETARGALGYDPSRPQPDQRNRVFSTADILRANGAQPRLVTEGYGPIGYGDRDQLRILLCEGETLLGWVGVFRSEPFTESERERFSQLIRPLHDRLLAERQLSGGPVLEAGFDAIMESLTSEAHLIRVQGERLVFVESNALGRAALEADRSRIVDELRATFRGSVQAAFRATCLKAAGQGSHFLAVRRSTTLDQLEARLQGAGERWSLTPRQRAVLERLARGRSNKAIANELACAEVTVEQHITALLNKSDSESRADLVARFWTLSL